MKIAELFEKNITRNINGVIKVGQQDSANIYQELDEYVVTKELDKHFQTFFERYANALEQPTDKMGVWISGFFGSGKSHFLKIISYLLANREVNERQALDFFDEQRVPDPILRGNIAKAAHSSTDVILFNIDSKADVSSKNKKDAIAQVFQKVFDEHLGYFGSQPALAEFERNLDHQGNYQAFKTAFQEINAETWEASRDAWGFCQDEIVEALQQSTGMSEDSATRLLERLDENYSLSPEKFANTVKDYLDTKGKHHYLIFMVDEVGQYIGDNSDLMLNLQTVVEDLGTYCQGRAWVAVTSQEAMDEITKNKLKGKDFSKIVGRFYRPLSLSSTNTDEVIKLRLLKKKDAAQQSLQALYAQKQAILKNQITFTADSAEMPGYRNEADFVGAYPFVTYQFKLLQNVFTQIRLMGAAGKHLSEGERSLLDGFQIASKAVAEKDLSTLVPFHTFYLAVEGFLDTAVSRVIDTAATNPQLQPFDIDLLKTLFLIKYVKEINGNVDNLTTLSLNHIDQDKLKLKDKIEEALKRLEKQTLIQGIGDVYEFLTHEEQDIGREIKNTEINPGEVTKVLQKMVWDEIFTDKKFQYDLRHQYDFNRLLDDQSCGKQTNDIGLNIITPYADRYGELREDSQCLSQTYANQAVLVRLAANSSWLDELDEFVKTESYIQQKKKSNRTQSIESIISARGEENSRRKQRLRDTLKDLIARADVFACGNKIEISSRESKSLLIQGLRYLVDNVYSKLNYIDSGFEKEEDITNALEREYEEVGTSGEAFNARSRQEILTFLTDEARTHRHVTIKTLVDKFGSRPYGWSELDTLGVMAELVSAGKVEIRHAQSTMNPKQSGLVKDIRSSQGKNRYTVRLGEVIKAASLKVAKNLANDLLETVPGDANKLFDLYQETFRGKSQQLQDWLKQAETEDLPFVSLLQTQVTLLEELLALESPAQFFDAVRQNEDDLEDYIEAEQKLNSFFAAQVKLFRQAQRDLKTLEPDLRHIQDPELLQRVKKVQTILKMSDPTAQIPQLPMELAPVKEKIQEILQAKIEQVKQKATSVREEVGNYVAQTYADFADQLNVERFQQQLEGLANSANQAQTVDSAIARSTELESLSRNLIEEIDQQAAAISQQQQEAQGDTSQPVVKPIVSVQVARVAQKSVLETTEDVEQYIGALREKLLTEIEQNQRVRLE